MKRMNVGRFVKAVFCLFLILAIAGCQSGADADDDGDDKEVIEEDDEDIPEFSDEYLVGINYGGSGWGEFYECLDANAVICRNHEVIISMATKVEYHDVVEAGQIATITLTDEQYENIEKGLNLKKLYTLDPKEDRDVCDGSSYYIYLYGEDDDVVKAVGGYMPDNKYFNKAYALLMENLPMDELNAIRDEQVDKLREEEFGSGDLDPDVDDSLVLKYYSDDQSVCLVQDYNTDRSYIIDGDLEIPVDISMGVYGPRISKCDVDGDGDDEYLIAECEGSGTGISLYGLCIVEQYASHYDLTLYDGKYFSEILEENVMVAYDPRTREVTFKMAFGDTEPYSVVLDREAGLNDVIWSDIIQISFVDGMPYLSAPSGYVFSDSPVPDYEQAVQVSAPILIDKYGNLDFGEFTFEDDNGEKTP